MTGMHHPVDHLRLERVEEAEEVLHALDYQDVALTREGARFVHKAAKHIMQQFMPGANPDKMTPSQTVYMFVDQVFWDERSGGLILCADMQERAICLPVPKGQWKIREDIGAIH